MNEPASDVIAGRLRVHGTLMPTLAWSVAGHAAVVALIWLAPARSSVEPTRLVMNVNLGGAPGPRTGGLTEMGGRAIPEPPPEAPKPTPRTPPPPPPARQLTTLPTTKPVPPRPTRTEAAPSRTPAAQEPPRDGSTRVETGARGQGFGLATGGNGAKGMEVENPNFCCPAYLEVVRAAIERAWVRAPGAGIVTMRFRILRSGMIDGVSVFQSSNDRSIDDAALRALGLTQTLPPLPREFPDSSLALRMRFENR
jgi:periplasmic protein TonB